jgi:hypothetical protein
MQCTMTFHRKIALLLLCFFTITAAHSEEQWVLEKSQGPIKVLSRHISQDGSLQPQKEIWAKTLVKASPASLLRLLDDIAQAPRWIDNCIAVKLLERGDSAINIVQSTFSAPWPLQDRDMVTQSITHIKGDSIVIDIQDVGQQYPKQKNTVRMTNIQGQWTVTKIDPDLIEISYQGTGNASGNIPLWLANKVLIDSTYQTFLQLGDFISHDKYQVALITH